MKTVGLMRKLRHRAGARINWNFIFTAAAFDLVRMCTLLAQPACRNQGMGTTSHKRCSHHHSANDNRALNVIFSASARVMRSTAWSIASENWAPRSGRCSSYQLRAS